MKKILATLAFLLLPAMAGATKINGNLDVSGTTVLRGDESLYSGSDLNVYTDTGSTLVASIDGAVGSFKGAPLKIGTYNINLVRATTSATGDSIKIQCGGSACSQTNPGFVVMPSTTAGALTVFRITSDVTINLTGATWGADTAGDLTGRILRALFINDNGTLRTCVALLGGRDTVLTTDTNATASNVDQPEEILCNTAVGSATNTVLEFGYFRTDFDDTGGSSENLNIVQSGVNDVVTGKSADGLWQPWNPTFVGFSSNPPSPYIKWTQIGKQVTLLCNTSTGVSNSVLFWLTAPTQGSSSNVARGSLGRYADNGVSSYGTGVVLLAGSSNSLRLDTPSGGGWTNSGSKSAEFIFSYEIGPSASFIE